VQSVVWSLTTEFTPPDQETSERRPYDPQGVTGGNKIIINNSPHSFTLPTLPSPNFLHGQPTRSHNVDDIA
jgi:hypothetical protein